MSAALTVADSKRAFHRAFPFVIGPLYRRMVDELLVELQRRCAGRFSFKADPAANIEDFKILNAATDQPLE